MTPPPIMVTQETMDKCNEFMESINDMFEQIDVLAEADERPSKADWVDLKERFKLLAQCKEQMQICEIYTDQRRIFEEAKVLNRVKLTKAEKLQSEDYTSCPHCKKVMTKRNYWEKHKYSAICKHIVSVENIASNKKGGEDKGKIKRVRISNDVKKEETRTLVKYVTPKKKLEKVKFVKGEEETYSIAKRVLILEDLYIVRRPCGENGFCCGAWGRIKDVFNPNEIGKYTLNSVTKKWELFVEPPVVVKPKTVRIKLKIKQPKKKIVLDEASACEKCSLIECCCEADRLQVLADDARAKADGFVEIDGRWIKRNESRV